MSSQPRKSGNYNKRPPILAPESVYVLPARESSAPPIIDTHTHLAHTYQAYCRKYPRSQIASTVYEFVQKLYDSPGHDQNVESIVDVWCEAPVQKNLILEYADAGLEQKWGKLRYHFAVGVHPHDTKKFNDKVEADIFLSHPLACALGEIGLDFHYNHSPPQRQREVFTRQLRLAVRLGKPLVIHTREAEADTETILKREVPRDWRIHVHCFTDSPAFAVRLLDHFPNLHIGITGVVTYATNMNTRVLLKVLAQRMKEGKDKALRILLETDAPYMVPGNIYDDLVLPQEHAASASSNPPSRGGRQPAHSKPKPPKLAISHSAMIPWTAEYVAEVLREEQRLNSTSASPSAKPVSKRGGTLADMISAALGDSPTPHVDEWTGDKVLRIGKQNAKFVYGLV